MEFLQNNWIWIVFVALFVWMMASGGGCCGSGKRRGEKSEDERHAH